MTYQKFAKVSTSSKDLCIRIKRGLVGCFGLENVVEIGVLSYLVSLPVSLSFHPGAPSAPSAARRGASWFSRRWDLFHHTTGLHAHVHSFGLQTCLVNTVTLDQEATITGCIRYSYRLYLLQLQVVFGTTTGVIAATKSRLRCNHRLYSL